MSAGFSTVLDVRSASCIRLTSMSWAREWFAHLCDGPTPTIKHEGIGRGFIVMLHDRFPGTLPETIHRDPLTDIVQAVSAEAIHHTSLAPLLPYSMSLDQDRLSSKGNLMSQCAAHLSHGRA